MLKKRHSLTAFVLSLSFFFVSCSKTYYSAMESLGYEKRDLLRSRIVEVQEAQEKTAGEFKTALQRFQELVPYDGGSLENQYDRLSSTVSRLESRETEIRKRIDSVDRVARDLFGEWESELSRYNSRSLKEKSKAKLEETRSRYSSLKKTLERVYAKIDPALSPLQDQVLYLKHNLNAGAIASLDAERVRISEEIESLIRDIQVAVRESEAFAKDLA